MAIRIPQESAWRRAWRDLEQFRASFIGFWSVEVLAALAGGILAVWRLASTSSSPTATAFFGAIGAAVGLSVAFVGIYAFNLILAPYRQRNDVREEVGSLRAQIEELKAQPNLEIVTGTGPVFRQERRFVSSEGFPTKQTLCRVGIRHDGHATVDDVSVDLESMKPYSLPVPLRLHQKDDNTSTGQFKQDFSLNAGQTKHVDVVLKQDDDDEQPTRDRVLLLRRARGVPSRLLIFHIVPRVPQDIPVERHEIVIVAHGRDANPVRQNFIIDVGTDGALQFASA